MTDEKPSHPSKSYDPGWNDPPTLGYTTSVQPTVKPKLSLNKRVAFPMQTSEIATSTKVQTSAAGLPMPFACVKQQPPPPAAQAAVTHLLPPATDRKLPPQTKPMATIQSIADHVDKPILSAEVLHNETLHALQAIIKSLISLEAAKIEEIQKRLDMLSNMWLQNRLDSSLQLRLVKITKSITDGNVIEATELHRSLAVDYGSLSTQWGTALRQLIIAKQQELQKPIDGSNLVAAIQPPTSCINPESVQFHEINAPLAKGRIQHL